MWRRRGWPGDCGLPHAMLNVRPDPEARFNVLLTEDRDQPTGHWTRQLPRLLQPQGVHAFVAKTGQEAVELVHHFHIHAAVIDLATPRDHTTTEAMGGFWLLDVLRRHNQQVPVVVVNSRAATRGETQRFLNEALRMGAFSVINRPVQLESLLSVIARLLERQYDGLWPGAQD